MKKFLVTALGIVVLLMLLLQSRTVQGVLIGWYLPEFPHPPDTVSVLSDAAGGEIHFPSASPFDLDVVLDGMKGATPTTGLGYLTVPEAASAQHPVPAMIILPGSGGISPGREREYAELLMRNGIASFVLEYYLPRGMTPDFPYLVRTSNVTEFDIVTDAYAALKLLSTSTRIDPRRIGLMGFSYGGMAARFAIDERFREALVPELPGFALYADFYGPCFQKLDTTRARAVPLLTLRGTDDASNDLAACAARERELAALGVVVQPHVFPGAGHAWENTAPRMLRDNPYLRGCELDYDAKGFAYLDGKHITDIRAGASRFERIAARITSGGAYEDCLQYGYIVGHDEESTRRGYELLLDFLARNFATGDAVPRAAG
ncbi:MAG: dienelactone hydrolase family protein [Gammaproteobacteria bacterium]|jgi:dienelactone hydrolase|nr:dienelactone hydrolase family protein [Gammaproteobacteria bacterium]MBP6050346.1 dienelactone hydrolase family protein [Pseudomonadales bacterium]MBK6583735.1 dienelactone hydrolase family protein [Gammaproteobacteria bacterium]MBK7170248.1 dienelactone hydrolase family protein [Gammaproteobacteria bacterium]MBK7522074.1 dienelactone hydrolase family protein [Gammaproteobacteria bacterium]